MHGHNKLTFDSFFGVRPVLRDIGSRLIGLDTEAERREMAQTDQITQS